MLAQPFPVGPLNSRRLRVSRVLTCVALVAVGAGLPGRADDWSGRFLGSYSAQSGAETESQATGQPSAVTWMGGTSWGPVGAQPEAAQSQAPFWGAATGADLPRLGVIAVPEVETVLGAVVHDTAAGFGVGVNFSLSRQIDIQGMILPGMDDGGRLSLAPENRQMALVASFRF